MKTVSQQIESALADAEPVSALINWVKTTNAEGVSKPEIITRLVDYLSRETDGDKKDALTDVLDALQGCASRLCSAP